MIEQRYSTEALTTFGKEALETAGLDPKIAAVVAETLVEGDILGYDTHGLRLLEPYLKEIERDTMTRSGMPSIVSDSGSAFVWDGNYLPGPFLVTEAIREATARLETYPAVTAVIRSSHHTACQGAYMKRITDLGFIGFLLSSDPRHASVAPFGGTTPCYSPNPIAAGIPTQGEPILIDISASSTAHGVVARARNQGVQLPGDWLIDHAGHATSDPEALFADPPGSILPLGGMDLGYKGFALGIMVEALTNALGGSGRKEHTKRWGASVFLQIINPAAFGGIEAFLSEMSWLADTCKASTPVPGGSGVRMPGQQALKRRETALSSGIQLPDAVLVSLHAMGQRLEIQFPEPLA